MASKKEHKRKQKHKDNTTRDTNGARPRFYQGQELNSLDLSTVLGIQPKAEPENVSAAKQAEDLAAQAVREAEEADRRRKEAEAADQRRKAEEESREQARREAEEQAKKAAEEEARRVEEEKRRREEEEARAAEQARREAEEQAKKAAEEEARRAEEEKRRREEQERHREEEARRRQAEEEAAALARQAEAERQKAEAEIKRRKVAEQAAEEEERQKEAEAARRQLEEEERRRLENLAAERARQMAEEVERARLMAEKVARARQEADEAERQRLAREEEARRNEENLAAERAREMAEQAEKARAMAEAVERARRENEPAIASLIPGPVQPPEPAEPVPVNHSAPPLEMDNPHWQRQPQIFDVLSGAPHGAPGTPSYAAPREEQSLPVTMAGGGEAECAFLPQGAYLTDVREEKDRLPGDEAGTTYAVPMENRMYIVMVTPEVAPCAKVGGLGDVILGLGRELMKRGHGVEAICPMYSSMRYDLIEDLHEEYGELWVPHYEEWRAEKVFQGKVGGDLQVNFITGGTYTERDAIYGYDDDLQRFTYFSRAALEFMYKTNRRPEIIHCHDWATGLVPPILWDIYEKLGWNNSRCVYTIHNNECQGLCGFGDKLLGMVGLDVKNYMTPDRMQDDSHKNCINMMKAGIVYSNFVTTVSPTYAGELKTAAGGRGLQTTLTKNGAKLGGVLNGIDYDTWNPRTDTKIAANYSVGDDFTDKYKNKAALREWRGLWDAWRPIISVVTRLTHQKGLDLIKHAIHASQTMDAQFVLLGSAPDPKVNNDFLALQHQLRDNHNVNLYIGYHEDLSHLIYAGSDMFLVPSLYEPCGLTQMISVRYGTVPIVRETGGLMDTVFDVENSGKDLSEANGFSFRDATTASLDYGLGRAVRMWFDNPEAFNRLARNGMRYDFSWRDPAVHYENIYNYIKA